MSHTTTVFATSFLIAVAGGFGLLDASPETEGPDHKPALHEVTISGARLTASLDRERVPAGEKVQVTLAMVESTKPGGVDLRVVLLEQEGDMMSRSMPPPREVLSKRVHLGDEPVVLPLTLAGARRGKRFDPVRSAGAATQYTVVVTAAKAGDDEPGAYLPAFAYQPEAYELTIDPPPPGAVGEPTEFVVHVKNLSRKPLEGISLSASTALIDVADAPSIATLAPGAETTVRFKGQRIAPPEGAPALIQVFGFAEYGGTAAAWAELDRRSGQLASRASEPYAVAESAGLGMF